MNGKWSKLVVVGALALGVASTGCVDEEASVVMHTNVIGDGTFDEGDEEEGTADRVGCDFSTDFDEPSVWTSGSIDLDELEETGQPIVAETDTGAERYRYMFRTVMENRLSDSRQVGAVSGGEGDGFQNLDLDKNDVLITSAQVTLTGPEFQATFERRATMLVQSGGGVATYGIPLIDSPEEVDALRGMGDTPQQFIAEIQLQGERLAGDAVESNTIEYPVTICESCAVTTNPQCQID